MRFKSLRDPATQSHLSGPCKGDEWLSPEGHLPSWRKVWNGTSWDDYVQVQSVMVPPVQVPPVQTAPVEPPRADDHEQETFHELEEKETDKPLDERDDMEETETSTEGQSSEQSVSTEVSDSDRGEQGAGGKPESEPKQRGKRGKVPKRGKG